MKSLIMQPDNVIKIHAGTKTQTRRVVNPQPPTEGVSAKWEWWPEREAFVPSGILPGFSQKTRDGIRCPYGTVDSALYVKEALTYREDIGVHHYANGQYCPTFGPDGQSLKPRSYSPMFMPPWASRLTLKITDVRVERLWDITEADAIAEGCDSRDQFIRLWNWIHDGPNAFEKGNRWVWVISVSVQESRVKTEFANPLEVTAELLRGDLKPLVSGGAR